MHWVIDSDSLRHGRIIETFFASIGIGYNKSHMVSIALILSPFLIFLSGYFITSGIPWIKNLSQRLAISLVTSIALGVVSSYFLYLIGLFSNFYFLSFWLSVFLIVIFIFKSNYKKIIEEWGNAEKKEKIFLVCALAVSILAGVFIFSPHSDYSWPIHADEWWVIGVIQNTIHGQGMNVNPYTLEPVLNHKPGFSSYFSSIFSFLNIDPIRAWPYLPAINIFLLSFVASLLFFYKTKIPWLSLLVIIFLVALKSNLYMLGWWFFVPSIFAFLFILPLFFLTSDWLGNLSGRLWALLVFLALSLVYLPYAALVFLALLPLIFGSLGKYKFWISSIFLVLTTLLIKVGLSLSPYKEYWNFSGAPKLPPIISEFISSFFVPVVATFYEKNFINILDVVSVLTLLFVIFSFWLWKNNTWLNGFKWAFLFSSLNLLLIWSGGFSFGVFHQRAFYFFGVVISVLAPMGILVLYRWLSSFDIFQKLGIWKNIFSGILFIQMMAILFLGYFNSPSGLKPYHLVNDEGLTAMQWLASKPELRGNSVVSPVEIGTILTPLTGLISKTNLLSTQSVSATINGEEFKISEIKDCDRKKELILEMQADLLYSKIPQFCPFLEEIYSSSKVFIYKFNK